MNIREKIDEFLLAESDIESLKDKWYKSDSKLRDFKRKLQKIGFSGNSSSLKDQEEKVQRAKQRYLNATKEKK